MQPESEQAPDMAQLQRDGVPLSEAIAQCEAWAAAHPEPQPQPEPEAAAPRWAEPERPLRLDMWVPPLPGPIIKQHVEVVTDTERFLCLSLLHTIVQMIGGHEHIDPTKLVMEGLSPSASSELASFMRRGNTQ